MLIVTAKYIKQGIKLQVKNKMLTEFFFNIFINIF